MAGKKRTQPPRSTQAQGAKIVSATLKNADIFRTAKGGGKKPDGPAVLQIKRRPDFNAKDFDRKAADLKRLSDQGKLKKTKPVRTKDTHKDPNNSGTRTKTRVHRERLIRRLEKKHSNPRKRKPRDPANKGLIDKLYAGKGSNITREGQAVDPDHMQDLGLGGEDAHDNFRVMDAWTNREFGREIGAALADVPYGTEIRIEIID